MYAKRPGNAEDSPTIWMIEGRFMLDCGKDDLPTQVHHVKTLKDLRKKPNLEHWQEAMIARSRNTVSLCSGTPHSCHTLLHVGRLPDKRFKSKWI